VSVSAVCTVRRTLVARMLALTVTRSCTGLRCCQSKVSSSYSILIVTYLFPEGPCWAQLRLEGYGQHSDGRRRTDDLQ